MSQHDGESKAFGHQRQSDAIRWPTPDCGLEPIRAVVGWMGSVTGMLQRSSRTGLLLPLERKRGVGEQKSLGTYQKPEPRDKAMSAEIRGEGVKGVAGQVEMMWIYKMRMNG